MSLRYRFIYLGIAGLFLVIGILVHYIFFLGLVGLIVFIGWRDGWKEGLKIILFLFVFGIVLQWPQPATDTKLAGIVERIEKESIVLKTKATKVKVYGVFTGYYLNDYVEMEVAYFDSAKATNDNGFDYQRYLWSQGITGCGQVKKIYEHQKGFSLSQKLQERVSGNDIYDSYAAMFILGIRDEQISDYYQQLTELSVVHLFALSGLHIHLLKKMIEKMLYRFLPEKWVAYISVLIIGVYVYLIPFNISFIRAYLVMLLATVFQGYLSKFDCLGIALILMLGFNPYVIFSLSFIFSYFIYFLMLLMNRHKYLNSLVYLGSIPILLSVQYRLNLISLTLGVLLMPLISVLYRVIWAYVFLGKFVKPLLKLLVYLLNNIIVFAHDFSVFLDFSKPSLFFILSYYFIYFMIILKLNVKLKVRREGLLLFSLMIMFYLRPYYNLTGKVVMIDVGQGDCFLIQQPFNQGNILIDTGGLQNKDLAALTLVPYLHSQGIFKLDYAFLSHDDFDHCGAYDSLAKLVKVEHKITTYQAKMQIGKVTVEMLKADLVADDSNDQSLVMKVNVNHLTYLFTGDASSAVEASLIKKYPDLKIDVLKVSHHGSNSGTSNAFLETIRPKVALISCGVNNRYGHPHNDVIQRLADYDVKVYRSDLTGMVKIVYYGDDNYIYQ